MYKVYTDASLKAGRKSVHSYFILDDNGIFLEGEVFYNQINSSFEAEKFTVTKVIDVLKQKNIKEAEINTDCGNAVNQLNQLSPYTINWIDRDNNKLADLACIDGDVNFYRNNSELVDMWCGFLNCEPPEDLILNRINPMNVKEKHKVEMITLYKEITGDSISIDELFEQCKGLYSYNSHKGRKYMVYQLAVYNSFTDDHTKHLHKKLRDKESIVKEASLIELTETAYIQYTKCTKKNNRITFNQAKRKLYRDIQMSVLDFSCNKTGLLIYKYGNLEIHVKSNTIECIKIQKTASYGWRKDKEIYKRFNKILGL